MCLEFPADVPAPICTVYTYPHDWLADAETAAGPDRLGADRGDPVPTPSLPLQRLLARPMPAWKRALDVTAPARPSWC